MKPPSFWKSIRTQAATKAKIEEKFVMTRQSKKGVEKEVHPCIYTDLYCKYI